MFKESGSQVGILRGRIGLLSSTIPGWRIRSTKNHEFDIREPVGVGQWAVEGCRRPAPGYPYSR